MVNSEAKLLYIFYLRGIGVFDIWREEVRAHHLGRVEGNENSEGQNIFKKEEDFGQGLDKVPHGLISGQILQNNEISMGGSSLQ